MVLILIIVIIAALTFNIDYDCYCCCRDILIKFSKITFFHEVFPDRNCLVLVRHVMTFVELYNFIDSQCSHVGFDAREVGCRSGSTVRGYPVHAVRLIFNKRNCKEMQGIGIPVVIA